MFLVYENKEPKVSRSIGYVLKDKYTNIVEPKNIKIYSSKISQADTACIIRGIVRNRVVYYPKCILDEFFSFYSKKQKGVIFVGNQRQIEKMVDVIGSDNYKIIGDKKIISINL